MKRVLVMGNDSLLADAMASRLVAEISPAAIHVTHHEFDREDHRSLVMILEEGKPGSESMFYSFILHLLRRKNMRNVTQQISYGFFAGLDL